MANFFSAVQGKFNAKFHGRYLSQILEQIAAFQPCILEPVINRAAWNRAFQVGEKPVKWGLMDVQSALSEVQYLETTQDVDRRADLQVDFAKNDQYAKMIIEIKMMDRFLPLQLQDYIDWAKKSDASEDRCVVVLTAFPISQEETELILENKKCIIHMYLSDLHAGLLVAEQKSELIQLFTQYLLEEGYAMFSMNFVASTEKNQNEDYQSFISFMVLNFLPHASGWKRVASAKKIARGPEVFSHLIQNWQLVSDRLARTHLAAAIRPTVRYFPEQISDAKNYQVDSEKWETGDLLENRRSIRKGKSSGRYWLTADIVLDSTTNMRLEWGQIFQIQIPTANDKVTEQIPVQCSLYALVRVGQKQLGASFLPVDGGITNSDLYMPEPFMKLLFEQIEKAKKQAINDDSLKGTQAFDWGKRRKDRQG